MGCNWLKGPREAAGFTQEALAVELRVNVKTIQRLERCGADTPQQVPYADLATASTVCPLQLAEDHARDLTANGQPVHARRAREAADQLRLARHFPPIDPAPIQRALVACRASGLGARIAEWRSDLPDEQTQAEGIARLLDAGDLDGVNRVLNHPLTGAIAGAADQAQLDDLARFVRAVIRDCAARDTSLEQGSAKQGYKHHGALRPWHVAAMIDRSCGTDGLRHLTSSSGRTKTRRRTIPRRRAAAARPGARRRSTTSRFVPRACPGCP